MRVCGVDDAGRGPVIGPLVVAGVGIDEAQIERLTALGVRDSKQLPAETRARLSKEIPKIVDECHIVELQVSDLDRIVNRAPKFQRLNLLEAKAMADVIEKLRPQIAYVDSSDTRTERFKNNILDCLSFRPRIVSEHKADVNYPVVSAASIMAKVHRDGRIDELKREYGEIGSGYAHDPLTVKFLRQYYAEHGDFPPIVRRSWKTLNNILSDLAQTSLS
ncbi:MAG TPA: ribonuclease HII [Candidatus Bathyarchaeia archaeon]|nr:ribonuclease HII [Candidatus Bathyarchaeia archaeon]